MSGGPEEGAKGVVLLSPGDLEGELGETSLWRDDVERSWVTEIDQLTDFVTRSTPRLVLLDWPDFMGLRDAVVELRSVEPPVGAGIAVLSRSLTVEQERQILAAGANLIVPVPVNTVIWSSRFETLLNVPPRRSLRTPVNVVVWANSKDDENGELRGMGINIGSHGLLLETDRPLDVGTKADLRFHLPGFEKELQAVGDVVWREEEPPRRYRCGLEFLVMRGATRELVDRYVRAVASAPFGSVEIPESADDEEFEHWRRELKASEARIRAILDSDPTAVVTLDVNGRVLEFNRAAERLFGYQRREVVGRFGPELFVPPSLQDDFHRAARQHLGSAGKLGSVAGIESRATRRDGTEFPIELAVSTSQVKDEVLVTTFIRDLTDSKEAELRRKALELQILQKQKLESLGVLASGIAHDLNNLLMGILGRADLALAEFDEGDPAVEDLEGIVTAATRAGELCDRLLSYGGRRKVERVPVDLNQIIEEMVSLIQISVLKRVDLRFQLGSDLPVLEADSTQLRQVILNLITNAAEALERQAGQSIVISTGVTHCDVERLAGCYGGADAAPGEYVFLEIEDSGMGIPEENLDKIFDPFFTTKLEGRDSVWRPCSVSYGVTTGLSSSRAASKRAP